MIIQLNSDASAELSTPLALRLERIISDSLRLFHADLTRVEAHLSRPNNYRLLVEARVASLDPVAVDAEGMTPQAATVSAADKMARKLTTIMGRRSSH